MPLDEQSFLSSHTLQVISHYLLQTFMARFIY
jgi:hypothetical protein